MEDSLNFYRWYDEPDFISVRLERDYLNKLIIRAIRKSGTIASLSKITGLSKATIHNYKNSIGMNIKGLKVILKFLSINYDRINHKIESIGWDDCNLNIDFSSNEMAILLAASLGDGHLGKACFMYKNKNLELINRIKSSIKSLYGPNIKIIDKIAKNGVPFILCSSFLKRQLERLGSPSGKKLFQNPSVPLIVKNGTKLYKKLFIQQFFEDEGWPEIENRRVACCQCSDTTKSLPILFINNMELNKSYYPIKIPNNLRPFIVKPNLLVDIGSVLKKDFQINTKLVLKRITKRNTLDGKGYVSATWELSCNRKQDVKSFYSSIGFFSSNKQKLLKQIIQENPIPKDIAYKLLNLAIKFKREKECFTVKDVQLAIRLERGKIRKRLGTLVKKNILYNKKGKYCLRLKI